MPLAFTSKDFVLANGSDVWLTTLTSAQAVPPSTTFGTTTTGSTTTNIVLAAATTVKMYENQRVIVDAAGTPVQATLTADVNTGSTNIPVKALAGAPTTGKTITGFAQTPIYSCRTASSSLGEETVNNRNFKSGDWDSNAIVMRSWSMSCSGTCVIGDPGYTILAARAKLVGLGARVYVEIREPNGLGESGVAYVQGLERSRENDNQVQLSWTFLGDGPLTDIAADA